MQPKYSNDTETHLFSWLQPTPPFWGRISSGIGFLTADQIAEKLGFDRNSLLRAKAGLLYILQQLADEGNVYYPLDPLLEKCNEILGVEKDVLLKAMDEAAGDKVIVMEDKAVISGRQENQEIQRTVYLSRYHASEAGAAAHLKTLLTSPKRLRHIDPDKAASWVQEQLSMTLAANQIQVIKSVALNKVLVITGGPGTGKTTIINAILKILPASLSASCWPLPRDAPRRE